MFDNVPLAARGVFGLETRRAQCMLSQRMKNQFTAIIEKGQKYLIATCPEVPEAAGQGRTRTQALRDLADSIQSVLEYRRDDACRGWAQMLKKL